MEILEKLFGSSAKVKVIKLFLMNRDRAFGAVEVAQRARVSEGIARREIYGLERMGFLKKHSYTKEARVQKNRSITTIKKKMSGWTLDRRFPYIDEFDAFLSNINPFKHKDIVDKISHSGKIQLLVVSGVFIKYPEARADLLVVGDNIKMNHLENTIKTIESEIGQEIKYAIFETSEFNYRHSMFDKLIRDILDFKHEKIINKLGV